VEDVRDGLPGDTGRPRDVGDGRLAACPIRAWVHIGSSMAYGAWIIQLNDQIPDRDVI
jgi:hypothetical protein